MNKDRYQISQGYDERFESFLLYLFEADGFTEEPGKAQYEKVQSDYYIGSNYCRKPNMPWLIGFEDKSERLFTADTDLMIHSIPDLIGDYNETSIFDSTTLQWFGIERLKKPLNRPMWLAGGKNVIPYILHRRIVDYNGQTEYFRMYFGWDVEKDKFINSYAGNQKANQKGWEHVPVLVSSLIEDCIRPEVCSVSISSKSGCGFKIAVDHDSIFDLFAIRNSPLGQSGKRRPLIHWVKEHSRTYQSGKKTIVNRQKRGVTNFSMSGYDVTVTVP